MKPIRHVDLQKKSRIFIHSECGPVWRQSGPPTECAVCMREWHVSCMRVVQRAHSHSERPVATSNPLWSSPKWTWLQRWSWAAWAARNWPWRALSVCGPSGEHFAASPLLFRLLFGQLGRVRGAAHGVRMHGSACAKSDPFWAALALLPWTHEATLRSFTSA